MELVALVFLILVNGFFAMSEISLVTARRARLQRLIDAGDLPAQLAARLGAEPTKFLSTIQIGITSVGLLSGIVGEATLAPPLEERLVALGLSETASGYLATTIVVALVTYFAIVVGELVPKRIGQTHAETVARLVAPLIQSLAVISKPFVALLGGSTNLLLRLMRIDERKGSAVTEEEIDALLAEGSAAGVIERDEHRMVRNLFRLDDLTVVSLMTPRLDMVTLDVGATKADVLATLDSSPHARYPVVRGSDEDIVGVVSARELLLRTLRGDALDLEAAVQPPIYVPESISGMDLLDNFRKTGDHMAFVINEYGTVLGLITLHDLLEAITGSIVTPGPDGQLAVAREDGSWLLDGQISIHEMADLLGIRLDPGVERDYHTLGGMIVHALDRLPKVGEQVRLDGWQFEVVDMDGNRVDRVLASSQAPAQPPPG